jgi:hypothetical protein
MMRREIIRRFLEQIPPETQLDEKIRSQTYTVTTVSRKTIESLEELCRKHNGTPATTLPETQKEVTPARPHDEIDLTIRKEIAKEVGLKKPPPETIQNPDDFNKLSRSRKLELCKEIMPNMKAIEDKIIEDPETKKLYDFYLKQEKDAIAGQKKKPVEELTKKEIKQAERKAKEDTFIGVCGLRIQEYFKYLARPDLLELYIQPEPEKKPLEKIMCTQYNPKWNEIIKAITEICFKAREHILEKWEPFRFDVEANIVRPIDETRKEFIQVIDEAYPNIAEPRRIPAHRVTIRIKTPITIRVKKERIKEAIKYLAENRPTTAKTILTEKELETELILTMLKRVENRLRDILRAGCTTDIQDEINSLHPKQITMFREIFRLIASREAMIRARMPPGTQEEEIEKEIKERAIEEARKDLVKWTEQLFQSREEDLRKLYAEITSFKVIQMAGRTLFETLPTQPICRPRVTIDITKRKEREVTSPALIKISWRIVEEIKALDVEIEVEEIEIRIQFCTTWCRAIECVLKYITPEFVINQILEEAKRLKFVEVIIPSPSH